ncbi:MAG: hypothetical protein L0196_01545 [candidate division Zixibacteria bacterium]|nr:hypothetical protein [candidate division Zixibacteria bacterium]
MRFLGKFLLIAAAGLFLAQCGKKETTAPAGEMGFGTKVQLDPVDLPEPPAGLVYQAWLFRIEPSGPGYSIKYFPYAKFNWVGYPYKFTDLNTGTDVGRTFQASPDGSNLFTVNLTGFMRADTLFETVQKFLRGDTVNLPGRQENLTQMMGFLFSLEPASETGPDTATPAIPFLAGYSNDSGKFDLVYPYNYRHPDFNANYVIATPSDTLYLYYRESDTIHLRNEHVGVWFGVIDTSKYELGIRVIRSDTVLTKLARELLPGWQFQAWIERNGTRVNLGHFVRGDSADLENPYCFQTDSLPACPGEDLIPRKNPPAEFADTAMVQGVLKSRLSITLEPRPDNDPEMFPLIVFRHDTPEKDSSNRDPGHPGIEKNIHFNWQMENRTRFFPRIRMQVIREER